MPFLAYMQQYLGSSRKMNLRTKKLIAVSFINKLIHKNDFKCQLIIIFKYIQPSAVFKYEQNE